jgi:hypothetical protein
MQKPNLLPSGINAELLLNYYPEGKFKVSLQGLHKRNSYRDVIELEEMGDLDAIHATLGRMSIYNSLPEYMFHPVDRFDNLPLNNESEAFHEQVDEQEQEIADAYRFFLPIDVLLFRLRAQVRKHIESFTQGNVVMQQILSDNLTEEQRNNRFIRQIFPFLPQCKFIRGNRTLLTFLLRKVFLDEGLKVRVKEVTRDFSDETPRYENALDMDLGNSYVGSVYNDTITTYEIHYWSDSECDSNFVKFTEEVEELRLFLQDFFLSVETELVFNISQDYPPLRLNDEKIYNFLNYNTNI